ncbi:hypothetical protein [Microbulbifer sp. TYP-18]|uniref:hypothetical protein n=1 Tax=Microbulbifer sp. TYP-18 TaxID=3230024 RepID=UPI0034C69C29
MQHHSFGLAALSQEIIQPGYRILDLGPLSVGTTQAFLQRNCPCYIEDLIEFFADNQQAPDLKKALAGHLVPKPEKIKLDVILCWDLLNFLNKELIAYLLELLAPNLKRGTLLHAMMYTGANAPARPARFRLLRDFTYETADDPGYPKVVYQKHATVTLMESLGRFSLSNSLVQRQGMRKDMIEYFFEYESGNSLGKVRPGGASGVATHFPGEASAAALTLKGLDSAMVQARKSPVSKVIDCGSRTGRNIGALEKQAGELFVLDLHAVIQWHKKRGKDGEKAIGDAFSKFSQLGLCDAILSWDLLSFYRPQEALALCRLLISKLKPSGHLHLIFCKRERLPKRPATFEIQANNRVQVKEFPLSGEGNFYNNLTELIRALPRMQLTGQGHGKLPGGVFYHELALRKFSEA